MLGDGEAVVYKFIMPDGKATSSLDSVTEGRVTIIPGGDSVGKCWVMWRLEAGVPEREAVDEHWEYVHPG